jgi:hypothetical protein
MWLVDGLLAREKHTFSSPLPIEACRQNIGAGASPFGSGRLSPSPFIVHWWRPDYARLSLAGFYGRQARRIMRVHLVPNPAGGTIAEATTELYPLQVAIGLVVLSVFGLFGAASTSYGVTHGYGLGKALFPFGYIALIPVFALVSMRHATSGQVDALVSSLGFVLVASSVNDTATPQFAPLDPLPIPAPSLPPPPPTTSAPLPPDATRSRRTLIDSLLARRHVTLVSPLSADECGRRLDAESGGGLPFRAEWSSVDEIRLTRPAYYRGGYRYVLRARLVPQANGTAIETTTEVQPRVLRSLFASWVVVFAFTVFLLAQAGGHLGNAIGFFPVALIWVAGAPLAYFTTRRASAGQATFLVTTLENILGASPVGASGEGPGRLP